MKPASLASSHPAARGVHASAPTPGQWLPFACCWPAPGSALACGACCRYLRPRRASIVLSSVIFVVTSICGAPDFWFGTSPCVFNDGAAAGRPAAGGVRTLAEIMPTPPRGWEPVLGRRHRITGRRFRRQLAVGAAAASVWLAHHVVYSTCRPGCPGCLESPAARVRAFPAQTAAPTGARCARALLASLTRARFRRPAGARESRAAPPVTHGFSRHHHRPPAGRHGLGPGQLRPAAVAAARHWLRKGGVGASTLSIASPHSIAATDHRDLRLACSRLEPKWSRWSP